MEKQAIPPRSEKAEKQRQARIDARKADRRKARIENKAAKASTSSDSSSPA